ncbi:MAG: hypothetical protein JSR66_28880 [Proteobacteria bacterium]|nr:hypothetical protein [Pseudomonadota bacterium]
MARKRNTAAIRWLRASRQRDSAGVLRDKELSPRVSVYHYLEYPHALAIFSENRLRLANPAGWSDPYERRWLEHIPKGVSTYALCWNRSRFDEPAWRMVGFGRNNALVRIRCRVQSILTAAAALSQEREGEFYIGKVRYESGVKDGAKTVADALLRKSSAVRFEREVRALWFDREPQNKGLFLPIDAQESITQVMCSPHAHPDVRARIQQEFDKFGVSVVAAAV